MLTTENKVRVYGPRGSDVEKENQELLREVAKLRAQLAKIQFYADQLAEDISSIRRWK